MKRTIAIAILTLAGCGDITLTALTAPPPGRIAVLDDAAHTAQLSRGVALAFECDAAGDYHGPCRDAVATVDDEAVANVFASYLDTLAPAYSGGTAGPRARTAFVLLGLREGKTKVTISTSDGSVGLDVEVVP
jgi:hypothetical protein